MDAQQCVGCGGCVNICPAAAISFDDDRASINELQCARCGLCAQICAVEALEKIR